MTVESRNSAAISRQRPGKHVASAKDRHAEIKEMLEAVFPMWSVLRLYSEDQWE
jgi:hypothetical protein